MSAWIDFKALRAALDFEQVLRHYKVEVKRKGDQHVGFCPLPNHNGKRNSPSFSANLKRGIFHCFGCGTKGNLVEFAAYMENVSPDDGPAFRELALKLQKDFCPQLAGGNPKRESSKPSKPEPKPKPLTPRIVNAPLDFELKGLDTQHPYLRNRGFTQETIESFGLGFCSRGYFKDRIVIPLRDHGGRLVGYGGRVVDDSKITEDNPRYLLPGERERNGTVFEFRKTQFLYNGYRIQGPLDRLFVVESFTASWWLVQNGIAINRKFNLPLQDRGLGLKMPQQV